MGKVLVILFVLNNLLIYPQDTNIDCNELNNGVFELYEKNEIIGVIYRKNNYQIEKYLNNDKYTIGKTKLENCTILLNSYVVKVDLDTITWSVSYRKIKKNYYSFIGKPKYLKVDYKYVGEIKKINDEIRDRKILDIFKELENND
ncbi:MAG: hypothetical protein L3J08_06270 [Flavobacteriaceae bacterium]|nr:hypothetical protein [Flavobacteriaceae bacterium]